MEKTIHLNVNHMTDEAREKLASMGYDWQGQEIDIPGTHEWQGTEHTLVLDGVEFSYSDNDETLRLVK